MTHFFDCTKLLCESQKQKPEATSQTAQDEDRQALLQRGKTEIKEEREKKKKKSAYLLPSIRLPGRGLPLNMAAAHQKGQSMQEREESRTEKRERHRYTAQRKGGKER